MAADSPPLDPRAVTAPRTPTEFGQTFPASTEAAAHLWDLLDERPVAIIEVGEADEESLCGTLAPPRDRSQYAVVASIARDTGRGGAYLLERGASVREVYRLLRKRANARDRLQQARMQTVADDADALEAAIDRLEDRVFSLREMESGFEDEWLPRAAADEVYMAATHLDAGDAGNPAREQFRLSETGGG